MLKDLDPQATALAEYMSELSELAYCAGWMAGLELHLWDAVVSGPRSYGRALITPEHIARLHELSRAAGGWIVFGKNEETLVSFEVWARSFARWVERGRPSAYSDDTL